MHQAEVTEQEIEVSEKLRGQGEYANSLALTQNMLSRVHKEDMRFRLLFDILYCSTRLVADDLTNETIQELEQMPQPKMSRIFVDWIQAVSNLAFGKAQEALDLLETNLKSEFMEREDFVIWKYKHLAYMGSALIFLGRREEALVSLTDAHKMYPDGERETDILFDIANCMNELKRYQEAYFLLEQVLKRESGEMATLAMQHMADCCVGLGRISEALKLFADILKKLPCSLVREEYIRERIKTCMDFQEKCSPQTKPV